MTDRLTFQLETEQRLKQAIGDELFDSFPNWQVSWRDRFRDHRASTEEHLDEGVLKGGNMAILQTHHINYSNEWEVELGMQMHRCISRIQSTRATPEQYARVTNFAHSVMFEWNRMREELDTGYDLRQKKPQVLKDV